LWTTTRLQIFHASEAIYLRFLQNGMEFACFLFFKTEQKVLRLPLESYAKGDLKSFFSSVLIR